MSTYPITTSLNVIKQLQWVKESPSSVGTTPTSPTFLAIPTSEFIPSVVSDAVNYRKIGSANITKSVRSATNYDISIAYAPIDPALLEIIVNSADVGTAGDREDSVTFLLSQMHNQGGTLVEQYQLARGCIIQSATITINQGEPIMIDSKWLALSLTNWSTSHGLSGTPTFAEEINTRPWSSVTTGGSPLVFNNQSYDVRNFACVINHNSERINLVNQSAADAVRIIPQTTDITLDMDIIYKDNQLSQDTQTLTPRVMTMSLNAAGSVSSLSFLDVTLEAYDEKVSADSTEAKVVSYSGFARDVTLISILPKSVSRIIGQTVASPGDSIQILVTPKHAVKSMPLQTVPILETVLAVPHNPNKHRIIGGESASMTEVLSAVKNASPESDFESANFVIDNFVV